MSKIWVRHHILNGGEVWLQKSFCFFWYDWFKLDSELYHIDEKLNKLAHTAEELLAKRALVERDLNGEKKDVGKCTGETKGYGKPFPCDRGDLPKDLTNRSKAEKLWQKIFHPRLSAHASQKGVAGRQRHIEGQEGGRSVFLSEELGQFKDVVEESTGADTIIPYRHKDTGKSGKGKKNKHGKNRIKGESNEEYESRMEDLRHGNNHDDEPSDWN